MSSFTNKLIVKKINSNMWKTYKSFSYYTIIKNKKVVIKVPKNFLTDFASVPRIFWSLFLPDGNYTQSAVLHDYLYNTKKFSRKESDIIFLESMKVLKVNFFTRHIMYRSVRLFGWIPWNKKNV